MSRESFVIGFIFILFCFAESFAQQVDRGDSTILIQPEMDTTKLIAAADSISSEEADEIRSNKAALYAAILPGLGQIYNKKYWKLPILYGGAATLGFWIDFNNKKYQQYRNAYLEQRSLPEELWTDPLAINVQSDNLQNGIDYYRRNRDLLMILLAGVYFLQIVDAYVDAQLMNFDVSENISFRIEPGLMPDAYISSVNFGMKFIITLN